MKLTLLAVSLLYAVSFSSHADDLGGFLEAGKKYNIEYALDSKSVSESGFPRFISVIKHGDGSWYYVQPSQSNSPLWINFSLVLSVKEISEKEFEITLPQNRRIIRIKPAEQGAAANP
jgi:hypothetical protein